MIDGSGDVENVPIRNSKGLKGLIFQHNPLSKETANGKTLAVFFGSFSAENLAQIYVTPVKPDHSLCGNYFFLSESAMMKNYLGKRQEMTGQVPDGSNADEMELSRPQGNQIRWFKALMQRYLPVFRDRVWRKRYWDTPAFWKWLNEFKPDFLFFSVGNIAAEYEFVMEICARKHIPLILHVGDDYFTYSIRFPGILGAYQRRVSSCFERLYGTCFGVVAICEAMKLAVQNRFGGSEDKFVIAMNAIDTSVTYQPFQMREGVRHIVYLGNIGLNRLDTLYALSQALLILKDRGLLFEVDVYSNQLPCAAEMARFDKLGNCHFLGSVQGEDLFAVRDAVDVLLHVESFKESRRRILETGFSTKTPEIMYSGRPVLVVGPSHAAVVQYLKQNEYGTVITKDDPGYIADQLAQMFADKEKLLQRTIKAQEAARTFFDAGATADRVYRIISKAVDEYRLGENHEN